MSHPIGEMLVSFYARQAAMWIVVLALIGGVLYLAIRYEPEYDAKSRAESCARLQQSIDRCSRISGCTFTSGDLDYLAKFCAGNP